MKALRSKKIIQRSHREFAIKNIFFWSVFAISIVIGAIAFSVILFAVNQSEFDLITQVTDSKIEFLLTLLPFFWIILCVLFLLFSMFGMKHLKYGYRYSFLLVLISNILLSAIFGTIFFFSGGAGVIEQVFAEHVPFYESVEEKKISRWSMPENGFLSGTIVEDGEQLVIMDWDGKLWNINFEKNLLDSKILLEKDVMVKIIGKLSDDANFIAYEIRPWQGQYRNQNKNQ